MDKKFTKLIWLGAGSASEPKNILSSAEAVILVDARESACKSLQKKALDNVTIKQTLLGIDSAIYEFSELNLPEFSAIQRPTGLAELFPGIKTTIKEKIQSKSISAFIQELNLSDNNNLLIADIPDSNLALLQSLQEKGLLQHFNEIHIQTSSIPLYENSTTTDEVAVFLSSNGFITYQSTHEDPDLPWLAYKVNPLWFPLQSALSAKLVNEQENTNTKEALALENAEQLKIIENLKQRLQQHEAGYILDLANKTQEATNSNREKDTTIEKLHDELHQLRKLATSRLETITQLEQKNSILHKKNERLENQQKAIDAELLKAESQIDLLKHFFLSK